MSRYVPWAIIAVYAVFSLAAVLVRSGAPGVATPAPSASPSLAAHALAPTPTATPASVAATAPPTQIPAPSPVPTARVVFLPALESQSSLPPIVFPSPAISLSAPAAAPTAAPTAGSVTVLAPDAAPQIVEVQLPSEVVHPGQRIVGNVVTSSNVASVEVRLARYSTPMIKVGIGRFTLMMTVPHLPFFLRWRTYTIGVIARNTRGDAVEQTFPITVR